jgi:hypothetical protein
MPTKDRQGAPDNDKPKDGSFLNSNCTNRGSQTQMGKSRSSPNSSCIPARSSAINNSPRADVWPAGVFVASLGIVRHLSLQRAIKFSIVPATGLHSESKHFRRVPSKQGPPTRIFSQFSVFRLGMRRKWRFTPTGRPYCCAYQSAQSA